MLRNSFEQALARAVVEPSFRVRLLTDPADTLGEYGLAPDDAIGFEGINPPSLTEFSTLALRRLWGDPHAREMNRTPRTWVRDRGAFVEGYG